MSTFTYSAVVQATSWQPSPDRTTIVPAMSSGLVRGITAATGSILGVPAKQQQEDLDFSFDISANLPAGDTIASVECSASQPAGLSILYAGGSGTLATLWLSGGTAGQTYFLALTIVTKQARVRYLQATILVPGNPNVPAVITVVTVPQSYVDDAVASEASARLAAVSNEAAIRAAADVAIQSVAAAAVPRAGGSMTGPLRPTIADGLSGAGTNQATAQLITAQNVVITNALEPFRLPAASDVPGGILGPITIRNKDLVNNGTVYPPVGGQIDGIGENNPIGIGSGGQLTLLPGTTSGQWWA